MRARGVKGLAIAGVLLCAAARSGSAQQAPAAAGAGARLYHVVGTVADDSGTPLDQAGVMVLDRDTVIRSTRTDREGHFRFERLPSPHIVLWVRRLSYRPKTLAVDASEESGLATAFVKLDVVVDTLTAVDVNAAGEEDDPRLAAFRQRQQHSKFGYFIGPDQLADQNPEHPSDALRSVPGVVVRPAGIGNIVRIRGCQPLVWVDGMRQPAAEIDDIASGPDVLAIEVYKSNVGVPAEFTDRDATCGTVLVWLKNR
jgi:hypothetical protein